MKVHEKVDCVDILERTVQNKQLEIVRLRLEVDTVRMNQLFCIYCEHRAHDVGDLKEHIKDCHEAVKINTNKVEEYKKFP